MENSNLPFQVWYLTILFMTATKKAYSVNLFFDKNVTPNSVLFTDRSNTYQDPHRHLELHVTEKSSGETTANVLKWVHIAISNAKRTFHGVYHQIRVDYLQNYLNEFNYRLNRRFSGDLFEGVIRAAVFPYWYNCV